MLASQNALADGRSAGFSTREVADFLGLKPGQVRHYVRRQLITPARSDGGHYRFSFQDVVLLRTAKALLNARISPRRANRALLKLRSELADDAGPRTLASIKIQALGQTVVVREDASLWSAESGQGYLDFEAEPAERPTARIEPISHDDLIVVSEPDQLDTDAWYNMGLDLEEIEPDRAPEAYRRAIAIDPDNVDAHVNLGRLCQIKGDLRRAKRHYEKALRCAPEHQLAAYNLGTVFDELDELERAAGYYRNALDVPDSHYNLARISELAGDELAARRYMRSYRALLDQQDDS